MTVLALEVLLSGLAAGGVSGLVGIRWWASRRQRVAAEREREARRLALWEPRIRYSGGFVVIDLVRIARWDGREVLVEADDRRPLRVDENDRVAVEKAREEMFARAVARNTT